jgi:hypothetical protein
MKPSTIQSYAGYYRIVDNRYRTQYISLNILPDRCRLMHNIGTRLKHFCFIALPNEVFIVSVILSDCRYSNGLGLGRKQTVLSM